MTTVKEAQEMLANAKRQDVLEAKLSKGGLTTDEMAELSWLRLSSPLRPKEQQT